MIKKRGRPKLARADKRGTAIKVPVTVAEKEALEAGASARGLPVTVWIRMVALEAASKG